MREAQNFALLAGLKGSWFPGHGQNRDRYIDGFDIVVDLRSLSLRQSFCPRLPRDFFHAFRR
jgi:hypothetical protein